MGDEADCGDVHLLLLCFFDLVIKVVAVFLLVARLTGGMPYQTPIKHTFTGKASASRSRYRNGRDTILAPDDDVPEESTVTLTEMMTKHAEHINAEHSMS
ncbi:hypothetical protein QVD17_24002 [Tagetes erecta]|uniref:Uncharacterized protein n=1 Tax=Tagetes erecta TaxID=13708 RepID=A0AAD8KEP6_TARER|nr:hypothetical protein QVD17_24002 [Tagetes erecta]